MRCALTYPKIPDTKNCPLKNCIAQVKYDGTCIHIDFEEACGSIGFGTRRDVFDDDLSGAQDFRIAHPGLDEVPDLVDDICFNGLERHILQYNNCNYKKINVFAEFFGSNSFAGQHDPNDQKQLIIFDVMVDGNFLPPDQLYKDFSQFNLVKKIYTGKYTGQLVEDIRKGRYQLNEGAIIKGFVKDQFYMAKIKTDAYKEKLKNVFKDNWENYWE